MKINMSKTEFIRFGNQRQLDKCTTSSLNYDSETIDQVDCVQNLGVLMDRILLYSETYKQEMCNCIPCSHEHKTTER